MVDKYGNLPTRKYLRPTLQYINALGGGVLLDMYDSKEMRKITSDFVTMLYEEQESVIAEDKSSEGDEDDIEFDRVMSKGMEIQ